MYKYLLIIISLLIISCTAQNKSIKKDNNDSSDDCAVSQEGQNDHFLKGINALKNYTWNAETKKATIKLADKDTLIITRGGCIHFIVDAEFYPNQKISLEHNFQIIFKSVLWITDLLKDFNHPVLEKAIETNNYQVFTNQYITTITFNDAVLKEKKYAIVINTKENKFSISQFLQ